MVGGSRRALRVLAVTNMYPHGDDPAYGAFVASQMRSIAATGAEVVIEFINGRRSTLAYGAAMRRVRRLAAGGRFDLVHAHYGLSGFVSIFQPLPLVVSFCGDDLLGTPNGRGGLTAKSRVARRLSYAAAQRAEGIICKSAEMRERLPHERDRARAVVIPNGVDTVLFGPGDRAEARRRLGWPSGEPVVLFPSTPTERRKRLDLAEAAVRPVRVLGVPARLHIVQRVEPADMPDYYRAADCLILTSDWEGSPNVVKEALCCDLPVVSVDVGDVRQWLDQVDGNRVVDRNPSAIAAALQQVLETRQRVSGVPIREALALPTVARRILKVYEQAVIEAHPATRSLGNRHGAFPSSEAPTTPL
jgi:teichuronic acid biosynthesis glycosyltransferase TuaC